MSTRLNPYLGFRDTARQAMEFYHSVFGGELTVNTFGDLQMNEDPADHVHPCSHLEPPFQSGVGRSI